MTTILHSTTYMIKKEGGFNVKKVSNPYEMKFMDLCDSFSCDGDASKDENEKFEVLCDSHNIIRKYYNYKSQFDRYGVGNMKVAIECLIRKTIQYQNSNDIIKIENNIINSMNDAITKYMNRVVN